MEDEFDNKGTSVLKIYWRFFWRQVESLMIPVGNCIADYMNYEIYQSPALVQEELWTESFTL